MIGALLAGGVDGAAQLDGRPLAAYAAEALAGVCESVAVVCEAGAALPELPGIERWDEPGEPRHPFSGIVCALERADGPVLVCAANMPFVTADAFRTLLGAAGSSPAVIANAAGVLEPALGLYAPAALDALRAEAVEELDPIRVALPPALVRRA